MGKIEILAITIFVVLTILCFVIVAIGDGGRLAVEVWVENNERELIPIIFSALGTLIMCGTVSIFIISRKG